MWNYQREEFAEGRAFRLSFDHPYHQVLEGWRSDAEFREIFSKLLTDCPLDSFTWEVAPVSGRTLEEKFECVVIKSNRLDRRRPSPVPFSSKFEDVDQSVVTFSNLAQDAIFVVPAPIGSQKVVYSHLKTFLLQAPEQQKHEFWSVLSQAITEQMTIKPIWVSTSKVGVRWLHARIDSAPKHYRHAKYREFIEPLV